MSWTQIFSVHFLNCSQVHKVQLVMWSPLQGLMTNAFFLLWCFMIMIAFIPFHQNGMCAWYVLMNRIAKWIHAQLSLNNDWITRLNNKNYTDIFIILGSNWVLYTQSQCECNWIVRIEKETVQQRAFFNENYTVTIIMLPNCIISWTSSLGETCSIASITCKTL